jgi:hypothetical protein
MIGGGMGWAGALVAPELALQLELLARTVLLCSLLLLIGTGLLLRLDWARRLAIGTMILVVHGQLTQRWMQTDVVQAWAAVTRGRAVVAPQMVDGLPALDGGTALWSLLLCGVMVWLTRRLLASRVSAEFMTATQAGTTPRMTART